MHVVLHHFVQSSFSKQESITSSRHGAHRERNIWVGHKLDHKRCKKPWLLTLILPRVMANNQLTSEVDLEIVFLEIRVRVLLPSLLVLRTQGQIRPRHFPPTTAPVHSQRTNHLIQEIVLADPGTYLIPDSGLSKTGGLGLSDPTTLATRSCTVFPARQVSCHLCETCIWEFSMRGADS